MSSEIGVIGDIHGDLEKVTHIVNAVAHDVGELVFVGDYVDRGPNSAGVIEYLITLANSELPCTFIAGNHDRAFQDALVGDGFDAFLQMGGAATVRSYLDHVEPDVERQLRASVPSGHVAFLAYLVDSYMLPGELFVGHSPADRREASATEFRVYGHTPQRQLVPTVTDGIALIDTGCGTWPDGRLTCFLWPSRTWVQTS